VTGGTTGGEHLFECSFNGGSQVIDLNEWDSESEASFKKKPSKMQSRTVSNDLVEDGTVVQKSSAHSAESARLYKLFNSGSIKPKSSSSMLQESNSIDVDNVISHMETLHDLEKLSNQKVQEQMKRYMDRRMEARGHLLQLMEHKMSVKDFREFYGITFQETKKLVDHVKLCLKMNEEIRWDLVFHILLSDGGMSPYG
jgi:RNA processing factor Prp31